ncbi:MAG TPA: RNA polymerase sigma factor [Ilumatobacter sp.]|nr:RNA polymerase sigma factor [Ilumatobacter sp.]
MDEGGKLSVGSPADRATTAALLERVGPIVRRALVARYGTDAGAEAAAEAVAWGWEHGELLTTMANPGGYLYRVGQTAARRSRRRLKRSAFPVEPAWHDAPNLPGDVFDALYRLTPDQRVAVLLVHGYRFSYRETADVMGVTHDAVRNHVHRGMRRLRAELEPYDRGDL